MKFGRAVGPAAARSVVLFKILHTSIAIAHRGSKTALLGSRYSFLEDLNRHQTSNPCWARNPKNSPYPQPASSSVFRAILGLILVARFEKRWFSVLSSRIT